MPNRKSSILPLAFSLLMLATTLAQAPLTRFRDAAQGKWGYKRANGSVAIAPRYIGAGEFRAGRAPIEDATGFAIIDDKGTVVERFSRDSVAAGTEPVPAPTPTCAWSGAGTGKSFGTGLQCYVRELREAGPFIGGDISRRPAEGEGFSAAIALKLRYGVVFLESIGYEGFHRRVLLPGVTAAQALQWKRMLYQETPRKLQGCSETWTTGAVRGGAFIEQEAGC